MSSNLVVVKVSPTYKEVIATAAQRQGISMSELMRRATAEAVGYDLARDGEIEGRGRPKKYETDEERKEAIRRKSRERESHKRMVVAAVMKRERLDGAAALERWLAEHGISLEGDEQDQPEPQATVIAS
jgi:hypothetical protein